MDDFEEMLYRQRTSVERYVYFRIPSRADADDVLQEVYLAAFQKYSQLKNKASFKSWILSIARNKCNDYFRKKAIQFEIPLDQLVEKASAMGRQGITTSDAVRETMSLLKDRDRQILYLYFWKEMHQADIAKALDIPIGTVKSRLYTARQNFKDRYPHRLSTLKGDHTMKELPKYMPEYCILQDDRAPFSVKWEELMGWFLVPRLDESLSWGMYDMPSRKCSHVYDMQVTGRAMVHGIEGVELTARETPCSKTGEVVQRAFIAQLTDTHCRYLATLRMDGDIKNYITFLDGDEFLENWGFGEDNCGNETNLSPKGDIHREGSIITTEDGRKFLLDIVGRYRVMIAGKRYDTVCVMDVETYNPGVVTEQYLDCNGRTILWRRFNRNDWALERYHKTWQEQLPQNERLLVNGTTYVHWYDCMTDYIL